MTADGGKTWTIISPDLTTNDKAKQASPLGIGPDGQDVPCTLIAIEESAIEPGVIWTGSNDGVVSVTRDGGKHWSNVTANIPNLPPWGWVNSVTPSRHAFGAAYITVDRHRGPDNNTYVFETEDYGRTWKSIGSGIPKSVFAYARVVREDPRRKGMLYLGTENGLYVTVDDGGTWLPLQNNLPHSPIAWLTVQEDFDDLVVATWGRGFWIMDDIAPLSAADAGGAKRKSPSVRPTTGVRVRTARTDHVGKLRSGVRSSLDIRTQPTLRRVHKLLPEQGCVGRGESHHLR